MREISPNRYRQLTLFALVVVSVLVLTGVLVRLTGSGLGCEDWPRCSESKIVDVSNTHAAIEQINRLLTGLGVILIIVAVLGATRRQPFRRDLRRLAWWVVAGFLGQIPLGGVTVLTGLHPAAVQAHFLLSMVLCALAYVLWRRASWPNDIDPRATPSAKSRLGTRMLTAGMALVLITGTVVTGTGPHSGELDPETNLPKSDRFPFSIESVARVHSIVVLALIGVVIVMLLQIRKSPQRDPRWPDLQRWIFIAGFQALIGYLQYFNGIPVLLVALHVGVAVTMWLATVDLAEKNRW